MKSIYDMMGRHTYPLLREDAPLEHVERFFQVSTLPGYAGGAAEEEGAPASGIPRQAPPLSGPCSQRLPEAVKLTSPPWLVLRTPRNKLKHHPHFPIH